MSTILPPPISGIRQRSFANSATDVEKSKSNPLKRRPLYSPRRVLIFLCKLSALLIFGLFMIPIVYILYRISAQYLVFQLSRLASSIWPKPNVVCGNAIKFMMWYMFPSQEQIEGFGRMMQSLERRG